MRKSKAAYLRLGILGAALLVISLACASEDPMATPAAPAQPAAPAAPTAAPVMAPTLAPGAPTPLPALPTPTRVLPTPTPVAMSDIRYGGTLRYGSEWTFTAEGMDPTFSVQTESRRAMFLIFDNLVQLAPDASIAPGLASSWDFSADGKTITFHLQKGVKFQDGTTVDAQAVKWNYDRYMDPAVGSSRNSRLAKVESVMVVDDLTVTFRLTQPWRPLMADLTGRTGMVVSPTAVQKLNSYADRTGEFSQKPVGSGPFKLVDWIPGLSLTFVRNDDYREEGLPYLDGFRFLLARDSAVRFAMFRTGEVDLVERMRASDAIVSLTNPNVTIFEATGARVIGLKFRVSAPPYDNKALRAAIGHATDRETLVDLLYEGHAVPGYGPTGPAYGVWYDPDFKVYEYDLQKARGKLVEAGHPEGLTIPMACGSSASAISTCEIWQAMLGEAGIKVTLDIVPNSYRELLAGTIHATTMGMSSRADPNVNLDRWYHSKGSSTVAYKTGYSNPEYDRLIEQAAAVYDIAKPEFTEGHRWTA